MNVESTDIVWIINNRKKAERYSPIGCRTSAPQKFFLNEVENSATTRQDIKQKWLMRNQPSTLTEHESETTVLCIGTLTNNYSIKLPLFGWRQ